MTSKTGKHDMCLPVFNIMIQHTPLRYAIKYCLQNLRKFLVNIQKKYFVANINKRGCNDLLIVLSYLSVTHTCTSERNTAWWHIRPLSKTLGGRRCRIRQGTT